MESKVPHKAGPFDLINWMFTNDKMFNEASDQFLAENSFILNRTFSIKWPQQAQAFNISKMNSAEMVKAWKMFFSRVEPGKRVPYWCYTKGSKRNASDKDAKSEIPKADIKQCALYAGISMADATDLASMFPNEMKELVKHMKSVQSARELDGQIKKMKGNEGKAV